MGDHAATRGVLENLNPLNRHALAPRTTRDAVIDQLAAALRARGHTVDLQVGQSKFRCDLAIRAPDAPHYALGILVDTDEHYENANLLDRYLTRPGILNTFGWNVLTVLTKDWRHEPEAVLERIARQLAGDGNASEATEPKVELPEVPGPALTVATTQTAPSSASQSSAATTASSPATANAPRTSPAPAVQHPTPVGKQPSASSKNPLAANSTRRYLEYRDATSQKFWEITANGSTFTVRFGRIGTAGQTQQKSFATEIEARQAADQLAQSKLNKGYKESALK